MQGWAILFFTLFGLALAADDVKRVAAGEGVVKQSRPHAGKKYPANPAVREAAPQQRSSDRASEPSSYVTDRIYSHQHVFISHTPRDVMGSDHDYLLAFIQPIIAAASKMRNREESRAELRFSPIM